ncbi:4-hydroxybenzoate polyprenyltransferase, mitochondrial [Ceratocystis fimbriata CBS 114723]|uniref:4-hydroxybenzoate polyprenyltransferase, mitochondrial n=1 Tax=Ceratocystis fimbriata CBS 114723 TaxID=1035309 RepID=A0A2C5XG04_9PEZI|nr:4-hydroxybenzoate polyprenyltransferase, mitochondrial [Ceratocystis fimbriata CBS 114723]
MLPRTCLRLATTGNQRQFQFCRQWSSSFPSTAVSFRRAPLALKRPQKLQTSLTAIKTSPSISTDHRQQAVSASPRFDSDGLPLEYSPPKTGFLSILPKSWVPYVELARMNKPAGTYYLYLPCIWSTLMAAPMTTPITSPETVLGYSALFAAGAFVMRGAGCAINDLLDRNFDPHVARTKFRPIARGALTPFKGLVFTGAQMLTGLAVLLQFPLPCLFYGIPSVALVALYPLAKRVTYYPQAILGLTFSWGAIMGFPALGIDLLNNTAALTAAACIYSSNIAWTILYDMVYAHMDLKHDKKAGVKSIVVKHAQHTKKIMSGLAAIQLGLLAAAGVAAGSGPAFFIGSVGGAGATLGLMIKRVKLNNVENCWWWFRNGCWFTGGAIATGLGVDYMIQWLDREQKTEVPK